MAQNKDRPQYLDVRGHRVQAEHFGKTVEVYTTPLEHWCVVHCPGDSTLTACWKMPKALTVHDAGAQAAFKTTDKDYEREWPDLPGLGPVTLTK